MTVKPKCGRGTVVAVTTDADDIKRLLQELKDGQSKTERLILRLLAALEDEDEEQPMPSLDDVDAVGRRAKPPESLG